MSIGGSHEVLPPHGYRWTGSKISIARQIGNAVPPRLAEAVALHVTDLLRRRAPRPSI